MKTATKDNKNKENVQNANPVKKDALMVVKGVDKKEEVNPAQEKHDQPKPEQVEKLKATIESFAPSAEERIKRLSNFQILTTKYSHLKMKQEELEKFMLSSDGQREKLVLENSVGLKIEVNNSNVLKKVQGVMSDILNELVAETELEVKNFVI